jgi:hypothetical protein
LPSSPNLPIHPIGQVTRMCSLRAYCVTLRFQDCFSFPLSFPFLLLFRPSSSHHPLLPLLLFSIPLMMIYTPSRLSPTRNLSFPPSVFRRQSHGGGKGCRKIEEAAAWETGQKVGLLLLPLLHRLWPPRPKRAKTRKALIYQRQETSPAPSPWKHAPRAHQGSGELVGKLISKCRPKSSIHYHTAAVNKTLLVRVHTPS